jgi:hypothetical protein
MGTVATEGDEGTASGGARLVVENYAAEARKPPEQRER